MNEPLTPDEVDAAIAKELGDAWIAGSAKGMRISLVISNRVIADVVELRLIQAYAAHAEWFAALPWWRRIIDIAWLGMRVTFRRKRR